MSGPNGASGGVPMSEGVPAQSLDDLDDYDDDGAFDEVGGDVDASPTSEADEGDGAAADDDKPDDGEGEGEVYEDEDFTEDPDAKPAEDDGSEPEADAVAKATQWAKLKPGSALPDELAELTYPVKNGDDTRHLPVKELAKGYQRLEESSRIVQDVRKREAAVLEREDGFERSIQSLQKPEELLEVLERNLGPEAIDGALELYSKRMEEEDRLVAATGLLVMRQLGITDERDSRVADAMRRQREKLTGDRRQSIESRKADSKRRRESDDLRKRQSSENVSQIREKIVAGMKAAMPAALAAHKLRGSPLNEQRYTQHLVALLRQNQTADVTPELARQAAQMVREQLLDERQAAGKAGKDKSRAATTAQSRSGKEGKPAASGVAKPRGRRVTALSMADFDRYFGDDD